MAQTTNLSSTQAIEFTTLSLYVGQELFEFVFPVFGVIGLIGNLAIIYGMARVKHELTSSLRFYYIVLAVADFIEVSSYYGAQFLEYGLFVMTKGTWKHLFYNASALSCKIFNSLFGIADTAGGFTVVCLGIERVIALTWPLRAKNILSLRFSVIFDTVVCSAFILLLEPLLVIVYDLEYSPFYWTPICTWNLSLAVTAVYMLIEESIPIVFTVLSFVITVHLIVKILRTSRAHRQLTESSEISGKKLTAHELLNVLTLISLSVVHLLIYMPYSFIMFLYILFSNIFYDQSTALILFNVSGIFNQLLIIPHSSNVFIYLFRSSAFRAALFGERFACSRSQQPISSTNLKHR